MKNKKNNEAVIPIISTLLLLTVSIIVFTGLYSYIFTIHPTNHPKSVNIIASIVEDDIVIQHYGGEPIDIKSQLIIMNYNDYNISDIGLYMNNNSKEDGFWNIGEQIKYNIGNSNILNSDQMNVVFLIRDIDENNIIVKGIL